MTLQKNDTVLITSPAGRVLDANIDNAISYLKDWGLNVELAAHAKGEYHNFSGTEAERLSDLQWALDHKEATAIFASRGGYGVIHLMDKFDWTTFKQYPKILIGYSDITNLHAHINNMGISSIHGLMPNSFPQLGDSNDSIETLHRSLFEEVYSLRWTSPLAVANVSLQGEIVGGNLSILYSLQGTPYAPDYDDKILFIEDVNEYIYHLDRILHNFALSGVFTKIKGILVGDFTDMKDNDRVFGKSVEEVILSIVEKYNIPVIFGLQVGHSAPTLALPLGKQAELTVVDNDCSLKF